MNLERVFDSILRIYPKPFRNRFGEELKLGFQDELDTNPSKLETAKLVIDALTSATWERLQATKWLYWLLAVSVSAFYLISLLALFFNEFIIPINNVSRDFIFLFIMFSPLVFLMRLEHVPTRLELLGVGMVLLSPLVFIVAKTESEKFIFALNFLSPIGMLLFAFSNQWTRSLSLLIRLLKFSLGSMAFLSIANNVLNVGHLVTVGEWHTSNFGRVSSFCAIPIIGILIISLLWKPRGNSLSSTL